MAGPTTTNRYAKVRLEKKLQAGKENPRLTVVSLDTIVN
jgi:hypothetical protein